MQENSERELRRRSTQGTPSPSFSPSSPSLSSASASPASDILYPLSSRIAGPAAFPSSGSLAASLARRRSQHQNDSSELQDTSLPPGVDPITQFTRLAWHSTGERDGILCSSPAYLPPYASVFSERIESLAVFQRQYSPLETRENIQKYTESVQFYRREEDDDGGNEGRVWKRRVIEFR